MLYVIFVACILVCVVQLILAVGSVIYDYVFFQLIKYHLSKNEYTEAFRLIDKLVKKYGSEEEYEKRMRDYYAN